MKMLRSKFLRDTAKLVSGALILGGLVVGCGDKSSDPDAVTVDELKYPGNLRIADNGNGSLTLWWSGANNEEDFDGYNVYGMKGTEAALGVSDGTALQLLNEAGEPETAAKTILNNFNYSPDTKLESKGASSAEGDDKPEFEFLPIHTKAADGTTALLPTCKASSGACTLTTEANQDETAKNPVYAVNGSVKFDVPDTTTVGDNYCFLVLSSMDGGEKVSQTSSNVACVVPKYKSTFSMDLPAAKANNYMFDMKAWLAKCTATGCPDPSADTAVVTVDGNTHTAADTGAVYVESANGGAGYAFVAGKNSAVIDLGYYAGGFGDATLPRTAPALVLDSDTFSSGSVETPIFNEGGYSLAGQSLLIEANHMYVIAVGDATQAVGSVTAFHYFWVFVNGTPTGGKASVEVRLPRDAK